MKIGQTALSVFVSKLAAAALGFVATVYFARELGADILGEYSLILAIVAWISIVATMGVNSAITKRVSEDEDPFPFITAGAITFTSFVVLLIIPILLASNYISAYIGTTKAAPLIALLVFVTLLDSFVKAVLKGQRLVHIEGFLTPLKTGIQSLIQIWLVVVGLGIVGMVLGYAAGAVIVAAIGVMFLSLRFKFPSTDHFRSLFDFAKYAWLSSVQSKTYKQSDILILGVFVSSSIIGVYSVAWTLAAFLALFSNAISQTTFPELSNITMKNDLDAACSLLNDVLSYTGLILIPGLVGGAILSDRLLRIYGPEFTQGSTVLVLLLAAVTLYGYQNSCTTALKAVDRPDLSFKVYAGFIPLNIALNVALIRPFGMYGAGIATLASTLFGLTMSYWLLSRTVPFSAPIAEIGRQVLAAVAMGAVVYAARYLFEKTYANNHNFAIVLALVLLGASVYFGTLFAISIEFRSVVSRNLPERFPINLA